MKIRIYLLEISSTIDIFSLAACAAILVLLLVLLSSSWEVSGRESHIFAVTEYK